MIRYLALIGFWACVLAIPLFIKWIANINQEEWDKWNSKN